MPLPASCRVYAAGVSPPRPFFGRSSLYSRRYVSMAACAVNASASMDQPGRKEALPPRPPTTLVRRTPEQPPAARSRRSGSCQRLPNNPHAWSLKTPHLDS